jgi:hypothetical protein
MHADGRAFSGCLPAVTLVGGPGSEVGLEQARPEATRSIGVVCGEFDQGKVVGHQLRP